MMFVNRVSELNLLENRYNSGRAEFFALYGRRRVGKTELLSHFCKDKKHIFFVADLGSEITLRTALSSAVNEVVFGTDQMRAVYANWEDLFLTLGRAAQIERLVVVFDEFPYMVSAYPPLPSILQHLWDQNLKKSQIMLILCGSYIGMMEDVVLGYQAPLYGRRTGQYLLEPLLFKDARLFYSKFSAEDQVRTFAVYGGTPAYLQTIRSDISLEKNILEGILTRGSYLYDEVRFILQQELREPRNYFAILQAVAAGKTRLNEIKQATGIEGVTAYLDTLQQLQLVERIVPVTETQPQKSRRGLYRLKDQYLRFWFRFVQPNRSQLEQGGADFVLENHVLPQLDHFTGLVFEDVCRQSLWQKGLSGKLPFIPVNIGNWWKANEEIDLIVLGDKEVMLVECKWSIKPVGIDILEDLEQKTKYIEREVENRSIRYGLCSRTGFTPQLLSELRNRQDVTVFGLSDILSG